VDGACRTIFLETGAGVTTMSSMRVVNTHAAAPAQNLQDEIRRMAGVSLSHLGQSDAVLTRCRDQRLVARLIVADAALGEALGKAVAPRRKAKNKQHQKHQGELNSHLVKLEARR
jgi:hypothetical protein